jgi:hypothetical protein
MSVTAKIKRFVFKRGTLPMGDFHELHGRMRERSEEWLAPLKKLPPIPGATLLGGDPSEEAIAKYEEARKAAHRKSMEVFLKVFNEEGNAQWDRIIDRRVKDIFYSVFVSGLLGFLLGKLM